MEAVMSMCHASRQQCIPLSPATRRICKLLRQLESHSNLAAPAAAEEPLPPHPTLIRRIRLHGFDSCCH